MKKLKRLMFVLGCTVALTNLEAAGVFKSVIQPGVLRLINSWDALSRTTRFATSEFVKIAALAGIIITYPDYYCDIAKKFLERFDKKSVVIDDKNFSHLACKSPIQNTKALVFASVAGLASGVGASYGIYRYKKRNQENERV